MECKKEENLRDCSCTYSGCSRKGRCCECIKYHRQSGELPGCLFGKEAEASFDRSVARFVEDKS